MAESRVTKVGVYAEVDGIVLQVTKAGAYAEIGIESVRVTQVGVYAEINSQAVHVTLLACYVEIEIIRPATDDIVPVLPNLHLYYRGATIDRYVQSFSLECEVIAPQAGDFTLIHERNQPTLGRWKAELGGLWERGLDALLGAEVALRGTSMAMYSFEAVVGWFGVQAQYIWPGRAWVARYEVRSNAHDVLVWKATLALSGTPERNSLVIESAN